MPGPHSTTAARNRARHLPRPVLALLTVLLSATLLWPAPSPAVISGSSGDKPAALALIGLSPDGVSCLIGAAAPGKLLNSDAIAPKIRSMQEFTFVNYKGARETGWAVGAPRVIGGNGDCDRHYQQELSIKASQLGQYMLGIRGTKPSVRGLLAKDVVILAARDSAAVALVAAYLKKKELAGTPVRIEQALRADLDGDGKADLIVSATSSRREQAVKGEYSVVLVQLAGAPAPPPLVLADDITPETTDYPSVLWESRIVAIADLDGDGIMEIALYGEFYHGDGWEIIQIKDGKVVHALFCGCGG